nr:MAG TPA: hypothetical protein [Caudoviricetes sp.]
MQSSIGKAQALPFYFIFFFLMLNIKKNLLQFSQNYVII